MDLDQSMPNWYDAAMHQPNRIRELREAKGWSQQQLADRVEPKTLQPQIDRLEKGQRRLTQEWMERIAAALGVDSVDLLPNSKGKDRSVNNSQQSVAVETTGRVSVVPGGAALFEGPRDLPILGHVKAGADGFFLDQGNPLGRTVRPAMLANNPAAYAVRVHDVSMSPAMEPGYVLFVDPFRPPKPGDNVVIELTDGQAFIKRLTRRTEKAILCEQFNPRGPVEYKPAKVKSVHLVVLISPFEP